MPESMTADQKVASLAMILAALDDDRTDEPHDWFAYRAAAQMALARVELAHADPDFEEVVTAGYTAPLEWEFRFLPDSATGRLWRFLARQGPVTAETEARCRQVLAIAVDMRLGLPEADLEMMLDIETLTGERSMMLLPDGVGDLPAAMGLVRSMQPTMVALIVDTWMGPPVESAEVDEYQRTYRRGQVADDPHATEALVVVALNAATGEATMAIAHYGRDDAGQPTFTTEPTIADSPDDRGRVLAMLPRRAPVNAADCWYRSCAAWRGGHPRIARAWKGAAFLAFHAVLPYEAEVGRGLTLYHQGLGVVVHPNTTLGDDVTLGTGVTIAVAGDGSGSVAVDDLAHIGAGATLLSTGGRRLVIGAGASVGANALVIADVPPGARVIAPAATILA